VAAGDSEHPGRAIRLELDQVEALRRLALKSQSGRRVPLSGSGMEAVRVFDVLELRPAPVSDASFEYVVDVPGECEIPQIGARFSFVFTEKPALERGYNREEATLVDLDSVQTPLIVRNWRPGDGFESPVGRARRKIKKLLLQRRVPVHQRAAWPVVLSGNRVVWARGFPVARPFRARPDSRAVFAIREEVLNGSEKLAGSSGL
jgi:tRNA(Ile)-lysidine synthase